MKPRIIPFLFGIALIGGFSPIVSAQSDPPQISSPPQSQTAVVGATASFSVAATGTEPLAYQWCKDATNLVDGGRISGATTTNLTILNVQEADAGAYTVVITNAFGSITSQVATLTVLPKPSFSDGLVAYYQFSGNANDASGNGHNGNVGSVSFVQDRFGSTNGAVSFAGNSGSRITINTTDFNLPPGFTVSAWVSFAAGVGTENPRVFSTAGYEIGTQTISERRFAYFDNTTISAGAPTVNSSNTISAGIWWQIVGVREGNQLLLYVNGRIAGLVVTTEGPDYSRGFVPAIAGNSGSAYDNFAGQVDDLRIYNRALSASEVQQLYALESTPPNSPPTIAAQSTNQSVVLGNTATFSVTGAGTPPFFYQWSKDGTNLVDGGRISGATTANLTILNVQEADAGDYTVVVSNSAGTATSNAAHLTVNLPLPGTKLWEFTTGGEVWSSPAIGADGTVYVGSLDQKVYALDGVTGAKRWEFTTGYYVHSSPAIGADGTVYVGCADKKVYALDGVRGAKRWEFTTGGYVSSSPAIGADGTVYVGSDDSKVYALDGATGAKRWGFSTDGYVESSPAIGADGTVYVGTWNFIVYALDGVTGAKRWEFTPGNGVYSSPAIGADGTVYVGSNDWKVYALDGVTGAKRWEFTAGGPVESSPAIGADGTVYVGSLDHKVYALDGVTGAMRWAFTTGSLVYSSPAIGADGTVYVGSDDRKLYALDGVTGAKRWEFATGGAVDSSPAIGADGTVYVGSYDNCKVYALKGNSSSGLADSPWPMFHQNAQHTGRAKVSVSKPQIVSQPQSKTAAAGANVTFAVTGTGTEPLAYQWCKDATNLVDGGRISGATTNTLTLSSVQTADAGGYSVVITNAFGSITSQVATLTVVVPPRIASQPQSRAVSVGDSASFSVTATGSEPLSYSWWKDGAVLSDGGRISGAATATLTIANVQPGDAGSYTVRVSNAGGSKASDPAFLSVNQPPSITRTPVGGAFSTRDSLNLSVEVGGTGPFTFQWYKDGEALSGATGPTYVKSPLTPADAGNYVVAVHAPYGDVTSDPVVVSVHVFGTPAVYVDGELVTTSPVMRTDTAAVRLETEFVNGLLFYTLDGTDPSFVSLEYTGPFTLTASTQLRAVAYTLDLLQSAEADMVEIVVLPSYTVWAGTAGGGVARVLDGPGPFASNSVVTVSAIPDPGWVFLRWEGTVTGLTPQMQVTVDRAHVLQAVFGAPVSVVPLGQGQVVLNPPVGPYPYGSTVLLQAAPQAGNYFARWAGAASGTVSPLAFPVVNPTNEITAAFAKLGSNQVTLTLLAEGPGTVAGTPARNVYTNGDTISVTATPQTGQIFSGWSGDATGAVNPITVTLDASKTITANFSGGFTLQLLADNGHVERSPDLPTFSPGQVVQLTAVANAGWLFTGWSGDAGGKENPLLVTMDAGKTIRANFAAAEQLILAVRGQGQVTPAPDQSWYPRGSSVTLTAMASEGFLFTGWEGDATGPQNPLAVTLDTTKRITAVFRDAVGPVITYDTPSGLIRENEVMNLAGKVTDNVGVAEASWLRGGQAQGALALGVDGRFALNGIRLDRGENRFTVQAKDAAENLSTADFLVTWEPARTLVVSDPPEQQEGKKVTVPVELVSQGDVGGMNFLLRYEPEYLKDPWVVWSSLVGASANSVNTNTAGEVRATFSLGGTALPAGTQLVAEVTFRARSVPFVLETQLTPVVESIGDALGSQFVFGTDTLPGEARILPRRVLGDNNANDRLDIGDATLIQRLLTHLEPVREWDVTGNDLNQSGALDDGDVTKVLRVVVGLDEQPPVGPLGSGGREGRGRNIGLMNAGTPTTVGTNEAALLLPAVLSAQPGQTVTVQVVLTNVQGQLAGVTFSVTYPVEALALVAGGYRVGALPPTVGVATLWNTNQAGRVSLALSGATAWPQANGVLAELTFQVLPGAAAQPQWPVELVGVEVTPDGYDNRMLAAVGAVLAGGVVEAPRLDLGKSGMTPEGFRVVFGSQAGVQYELQRSDDLEHWSKVGSLSGTGGELEFVDTAAIARPAGYYRILATL